MTGLDEREGEDVHEGGVVIDDKEASHRTLNARRAANLPTRIPRPSRPRYRRPMTARLAILAVLFATLLFAAPAAHAGMPFLTLSDAASMRFEALGFFIGLFFLVAAALRGLWGLARRDFPSLPAPTYRLALAVVFTVALLLQVVLTMISGARELMTPGAWEKEGATYRVKSGAAHDEVSPERTASLERLRDELWPYAAMHDGHLPANELDAPATIISADAWKIAGTDARYVYVGGSVTTTEAPPTIVAYEPAVVGNERLTLKSNGKIDVITAEDLEIALRGAR